jgi:hypothetical protein
MRPRGCPRIATPDAHGGEHPRALVVAAAKLRVRCGDDVLELTAFQRRQVQCAIAEDVGLNTFVDPEPARAL